MPALNATVPVAATPLFIPEFCEDYSTVVSPPAATTILILIIVGGLSLIQDDFSIQTLESWFYSFPMVEFYFFGSVINSPQV